MTIERTTLLDLRDACVALVFKLDKALGESVAGRPTPLPEYDAVLAERERVKSRVMNNLLRAARYINRFPQHRPVLESFAMPISTLSTVMGNVPKAKLDEAVEELRAAGRLGVHEKYQGADEENPARGRPAKIIYMIRDALHEQHIRENL